MDAYRAPDIPREKLNTIIVRDELLRCFESANREFARLLNQPVTDEKLKEQVKQFVEGVFAKCGVSFDNPSKEGIMIAINECRSNAEKMMGPEGASIIKHHYDEMIKLLSKLPG